VEAPLRFSEWCSDVIGGDYLSSNDTCQCVFRDDGYIKFVDNRVEYYHTTDVDVEYHQDRHGEIPVTSLIEKVDNSFVMNDGSLVVEGEFGILVLEP